ncbi:PLP-dependent aminotransferase family protein, partial [Nocardioides sp.]|uniref:aminotransferase-like domain-containing protein n=1 Tax=Nocardioides sp. TaxID=35761 RepID=UPI002736E40D
MSVAPLPVRLDRQLPDTLPVQLAQAIRSRIAEQVLTPGDRLPSSRALAGDLEVSRSVAEQAYEQLLAEGWLETRHGAGTFVAPDLRLPLRPSHRTTTPPGPVRHDLVRLGTGTPWIDPRQHDGWRRAWRDVAMTTPPSDYPDPAGLPELRAEIAASTTRSRGFDCTPEEVLVTLGTTDGLRHLLATLPPGPIAVEDPGYAAAVVTCRQHGRAVHDVPVDDEGLDVAALRGAPAGLRGVYVTPAHQHPTGATMSARRRLGLVAEAARRDLLVVEDDYDSEFRYDVAPLPSLAGLDR